MFKLPYRWHWAWRLARACFWICQPNGRFYSWEFLALRVLLMIVKQPSRFVLATLAFVMPLSFGTSFLVVDNLRLPIPGVGIQVYDLLTVVLLILLLCVSLLADRVLDSLSLPRFPL